MKKKLVRATIVMVLAALICCLHVVHAKAGESTVSTFNDLMTALSYAQDGDTVTFSGYIEIPSNCSMGYTDKHIILKRADANSRIEFGYNASGSTIKNITFDGNKVMGNNSVVVINNGIGMTNVTFKDCINASGSGGAITFSGGAATFDSCTFDGCGAADGGCIRFNSASSVQFNSCSFKNNTATDKGSVIRIAATDIPTTMKDCTVTGNSAGSGGAVYTSGSVTLDGCLIYDNKTTSGSAVDVSLDDYGKLTFNDTLDDLKALYKSNKLDVESVQNADSGDTLDISAQLSGAKNIVIKCTPIKDEPTPDPTPTPAPAPSNTVSGSPSNGSGTSSGSGSVSNTYNQTYSPTINNTVPAAQPSAAASTAAGQEKQNSPVQASVTTSAGTAAKTYKASTDANGSGALEVKEGANTITINVNVGKDETGATGTAGTDQGSTAASKQAYYVQDSQAATAASPAKTSTAAPATVQVQGGSNWLDVLQTVMIGAIMIYLFKGDALKVKVQSLRKKKDAQAQD